MNVKQAVSHAKAHALESRPYIYIYIFLCFAILSSCSDDYKLDRTERWMKKNFNENFETLVQIEKMHKEDAFVSRLSPTYILEDNTVNPPGKLVYGEFDPTVPTKKNYKLRLSMKRINQYQKLFDKAKLEEGIQRMHTNDKSRRLEFIYDVSSSFGYTFREKPPLKVFNSFKECKIKKFVNYRCYVYLRPNWYMHWGSINEYGQFIN